MRNREIRAFTLERAVVHDIEKHVPSGERSRFVNDAIKAALRSDPGPAILAAHVFVVGFVLQVALLASA